MPNGFPATDGGIVNFAGVDAISYPSLPTDGVYAIDTSTPPGQRTVPVGSGTLAFQTCSAATFNYTFTAGTSSGASGTINLKRVGPVPPGCTS